MGGPGVTEQVHKEQQAVDTSEVCSEGVATDIHFVEDTEILSLKTLSVDSLVSLSLLLGY